MAGRRMKVSAKVYDMVGADPAEVERRLSDELALAREQHPDEEVISRTVLTYTITAALKDGVSAPTDEEMRALSDALGVLTKEGLAFAFLPLSDRIDLGLRPQRELSLGKAVLSKR